jgi:NAD(P)-dependent dehydrogenase (short-subunit alcohol dehydrogenase family)
MTETVRTIALIGATSGLGRAAADQLARDGHSLVLVGRDPKRVERLAKQLPTAIVICADVSVIAGIDHAATQIESAVDHLDALVNNAGVIIPTRQTTSEGAELNFAVHHLAPYSMTGRLLPLLHAGSGRVVNVNSEGHRAPLLSGGRVRIDLDDLNMEHGYEPFLAYSRTKLANLLFTYELQRRHPELSVIAVHPGMVRPDLGRHWPRIQVAAMHAMSISARKEPSPWYRSQ